MVRKLIKHELISTVRIAIIPAIAMILLAILARIMLETSSINVSLIIIMFYVFAMLVTLLIGYFFGIHSFYQLLFTGTGYLTLSLPVTPDQLIWSKMLSAIIVEFVSVIICILSACIYFIGLPAEVLESISESLSYLGNLIIELTSAEPLFFVENTIYGIVLIPMSFLIFYAIMCVGQLFTSKNRKGMAIGLYILLIFVWSIFRSVAVTPLLLKATEVSIHLTMWIKIVFVAAVDVGCYFFVRYIIKNKVNLLA